MIRVHFCGDFHFFAEDEVDGFLKLSQYFAEVAKTKQAPPEVIGWMDIHECRPAPNQVLDS